jgi:hypothetical protein
MILKMSILSRTLITTLVALFAFGCASKTKVEKKLPETARKPGPTATAPATQQTSAVKYDESFDPASVKDAAFAIPRKSEKKMVQSQTALPAPVDSAASDTSWVTVQGYQLQLLQTENGAQARETLRTAILDLNADVEIVYDAPYYKLRAGKFLNRYDAELLQSKADEKGYANSWVVRTPIKVRAFELPEQR